MADVALFAAMEDYQYWADFFEPGKFTLKSTKAESYAFARSDGTLITLSGKGFTYDPDASSVLTGGQIAAVTVANKGGDKLFAISRLQADAVDFYYRVNGWNDESGSGFAAISALLTGNDAVTGSDEADDISAGSQECDDTVDARGGDDFITGDRGNDAIKGGDGFDTLTYQETFYNPSASRGVTLDAKAGTAADPWGGADTFSAVEEYRGSSFDDTLKGSDRDEDWAGLRGANRIDGAGGFDFVRYDEDARFGGKKGIKADLSKGVILDGWGQKDGVSGIEGVRGTNGKDAFTGDAKDNYFEGLNGVDTFTGGGGFDTVGFGGIHFNGAKHGVSVDLGRASGQVRDDGYGNKESLSGFKGIVGSDFSDTLTAGAGDSYINGRTGDDRIDGGGGFDRLRGGSGNDSFRFATKPDAFGLGTIEDVGDGDDSFLLDDAAFLSLAATGAKKQLAASAFKLLGGGAAADGDDRILYDKANGDLFYDRDGSGTSFAAVKFAEIENKAELSAADFFVV